MESITDFVGGGYKKMLGREDKSDSLTLKQIVEYCEKVEGEWNGDESGLAEDRANTASDIIEQVNSIKELLTEL